MKLPNVKTNTPGRKAVKVTYGGKNVTFYINVAEKGAEVTFELNYDGAPEAQKEAARQGKGVEAPEIPCVMVIPSMRGIPMLPARYCMILRRWLNSP